MSIIKARPAFVSWSGGKDSCLSAYSAQQSGLKISCLLNMMTEDAKHSLNFVVPPLVQVLSRQQLALEAQVFAATNIGLIMLPLIGTIGYVTAVALSQWPKSTPDPLTVVQDLMATLMFRLNLVVLAAVLLPFSLTLALLWAAKDSALRALTNPVAPKEPGYRS